GRQTPHSAGSGRGCPGVARASGSSTATPAATTPRPATNCGCSPAPWWRPSPTQSTGLPRQGTSRHAKQATSPRLLKHTSTPPKSQRGAMTASDDVLDLVQRWAAAEQQNDARLLEGLLAEDFAGVGPLGFVLGGEQWLARSANGLVNRSFTIEDPQ